jgi:hypothetical protein
MALNPTMSVLHSSVACSTGWQGRVEIGDLALANDRLLDFAGFDALLDQRIERTTHVGLDRGPLHVRLAGRHPHLADEHVLERRRLGPRCW